MKKILLAFLMLGLTACANLDGLSSVSPQTTAVASECVEPNRQSFHAVNLAAKWYTCDTGGIKWPANDGFAQEPKQITLAVGTMIDRYSGFAPEDDSGRYFSPAGASFGSRALPYNPKTQILTTFRVAKPFTVEAGTAAPWFGKIGGARQFKSAIATQELLRDGYIVVVE